LSNIAPLLDRNRAFAGDPGARQGMPRLPFIPNLNLYIVTCIDCRVDPAQVLGVKLGEALVQRNIGGRITPAIITDIAYAGYLVDTKAHEGPYFEVAIVHHTDCGSTLLADDELRHGFAQRIGTDEQCPAGSRSTCGHRARSTAAGPATTCSWPSLRPTAGCASTCRAWPSSANDRRAARRVLRVDVASS
jgi:carbonic anhydrase